MRSSYFPSSTTNESSSQVVGPAGAAAMASSAGSTMMVNLPWPPGWGVQSRTKVPTLSGVHSVAPLSSPGARVTSTPRSALVTVWSSVLRLLLARNRLPNLMVSPSLMVMTMPSPTLESMFSSAA